ncbi:Ldh family oxidoreductase [Williamsia sp. CHRR-6]|uniref:Ldh family oxidoreductase n=1 Tax=Williamsia sp. CHRR-6 TaxID=2835871 RepID=UPI001BDA188A|nr:Ldh family oxidoreductase [Williamsia sp. CHRR-6]MBT0567235.1 Ldh family oxidoreductase [Williamsia sp. CHRR-6]
MRARRDASPPAPREGWSQSSSTGSATSAPAGAIVVDAGTAPAGASISEVHELAGGGAAVLLVTADEQLAAAADRQVEVEPPTDPAASAVQDPVIVLANLTELVTATLCAEGVAPRRAALVARVLIDADARGHFSHGVGLLPMYVDRIRAGGIDPVADPQWVSEMGVVKVLDAQGGFGQVAAELAAETVAEDATMSGIAAVGVRGSNHIGMLAAYRGSFTRHGVVGLVFNVSGPSVAASGAGRATLGNDAVCLVAPLEGSRPFIVDFATGIGGRGKAARAFRPGRRPRRHAGAVAWERGSTDGCAARPGRSRSPATAPVAQTVHCRRDPGAWRGLGDLPRREAVP